MTQFRNFQCKDSELNIFSTGNSTHHLTFYEVHHWINSVQSPLSFLWVKLAQLSNQPITLKKLSWRVLGDFPERLEIIKRFSILFANNSTTRTKHFILYFFDWRDGEFLDPCEETGHGAHSVACYQRTASAWGDETIHTFVQSLFPLSFQSLSDLRPRHARGGMTETTQLT